MLLLASSREVLHGHNLYLPSRGVRRILLEGFPTCTNIVIERWDHSGKATVTAALAAVGGGCGRGVARKL